MTIIIFQKIKIQQQPHETKRFIGIDQFLGKTNKIIEIQSLCSACEHRSTEVQPSSSESRTREANQFISKKGKGLELSQLKNHSSLRNKHRNFTGFKRGLLYIIKAREVSILAPRLWVKLSQLLTVRLRLYWKETGQEVKSERVSQKDKGHFEGRSPLPPQFTFYMCNYIKVVMCPKSVYITLQQHLQAQEKHSANVARGLPIQTCLTTR